VRGKNGHRGLTDEALAYSTRMDRQGKEKPRAQGVRGFSVDQGDVLGGPIQGTRILPVHVLEGQRIWAKEEAPPDGGTGQGFYSSGSGEPTVTREGTALSLPER
jgi:hypothetical protein